MLGLLLNLKLSEQLLSLLLSDGSLGFQLGTILFELLLNGLLVFLDGGLHLGQLLLVDLDDYVWSSGLSWDAWSARLLEVDITSREGGKLLSQTCNLIVELSNHSVLRVLIDTWLVLDVLGARGVTKGR